MGLTTAKCTTSKPGGMAGRPTWPTSCRYVGSITGATMMTRVKTATGEYRYVMGYRCGYRREGRSSRSIRPEPCNNSSHNEKARQKAGQSSCLHTTSQTEPPARHQCARTPREYRYDADDAPPHSTAGKQTHQQSRAPLPRCACARRCR